MQGCCLTHREKALNVCFFLNAYDAVNSHLEQRVVLGHAAAVLRFTVDRSTERTVIIVLIFTERTHDVEQLFRVQMVANNLSIVCQIDHVERMQLILTVNINGIVAVLQHKHHARFRQFGTGYHRIQSERCMFNIRMFLDILQEVKPKLVQSQIHDVDTGVHIFNIHHFIL